MYDIFPVRSSYDARLAYRTIKDFMEIDDKFVQDFIVKIKRNIREWNHRDIETERVVKDYGIDGVMLLVKMPDRICTIEDAELYFDNYMRIEYCPTYYDCTGQWFTGWYHIFQRHGRWYVYHRVCVDC